VISIVTFKWKKEGYRSTFTGQHVNAMRDMVAQRYPDPHRFLCITDDAEGIAPSIEIVPLWSEHADIANPSWPTGPSCYRRLKVFSDWFGEIAGDRFACIDLDAVLMRDMRPIWNRPEDFLIWKTGNRAIPFCASMFLLRAGSRREVWDDFDPARSPLEALNSGSKGSDQAWIAHRLGNQLDGWGVNEGVYGYREHILREHCGDLPANARAVMFPGKPDPWEPAARRQSPWINTFYA
jgi:hypothetical protein